MPFSIGPFVFDSGRSIDGCSDDDVLVWANRATHSARGDKEEQEQEIRSAKERRAHKEGRAQNARAHTPVHKHAQGDKQNGAGAAPAPGRS